VAEMEQCDKHHKDLYYGDEYHPGLATRVLLMENTIKTIQFYGRWALVLLLGAFLTGVLNLVLHK
jgi:hypothetical protein